MSYVTGVIRSPAQQRFASVRFRSKVRHQLLRKLWNPGTVRVGGGSEAEQDGRNQAKTA